MRTIRVHDRGAAVEDVQRRLRMLGYELEVDGSFGARTRDAVEQFRAAEGLPQGDYVDDGTWSTLVDATFSLGDRMLYLRMPHFHGGDVHELQRILNVLGFSTGGEDGIFGAHTESALRDFQSSTGLVDDGIAGLTTFEAVMRLRHAWDGKSAASAPTSGYLGFARVAEVLVDWSACFYGTDDLGRGIASRIANLARATTSESHVTSADELVTPPTEDMLMVGLLVRGQRPPGTGRETPTVNFSDDFAFASRFRTAVDASSTRPRRVVVRLDAPLGADIADQSRRERWEQHMAIVLLDMFCSALA